VKVAVRTTLFAILGARGILVAREAASVVALAVIIGSSSNHLGFFSVVVFENDFKDIEVSAQNIERGRRVKSGSCIRVHIALKRNNIRTLTPYLSWIRVCFMVSLSTPDDVLCGVTVQRRGTHVFSIHAIINCSS
jgi:hypothetical protein